MYKVLIVDDEPKVRNGLTKLIPALDAEWSVIGQAKNGVEALEMVRKEMPDLVITDIRMPQMNGLDLLNLLREYPVQVVILSGYGYFDYAKTAIRFGAFDYLLKPLKPEEIRDLLGRLKKEIGNRRERPEVISSEFHYSKLWKDWLLGVEDSADCSERLQSRLPADSANFRMIAVEIDDFDDLVTEEGWGDRQLVVFAVRNIVYEILNNNQEQSCRFLFANASHIYFLLLNPPPADNEVFIQLIREVGHWVKISISVGIGNQVAMFSQLPETFAQAKEALLNKWIYGNGQVYEYRGAYDPGNREPGYPHELDEALVLALREGNADKAKDKLRKFASEVLEKSAGYTIFHNYCLQLLSAVVRFVHEQRITGLVFQGSLKPYEWFHLNFTADEFIRFMDELISSSVDNAEWKKQQKHNHTLESAVAYIRQHYMKDISLADVAGQVEMSSSYFSSFFKQELGISFIEALTQVRMDKAKTLMMDPDLKLYQISEMVGYQDVKYFSRLFKKAEGVTPGEYRQFFYRKEEDEK
ncbi:response regulator [Paenibacillus sp. FSL R5-0407]|uniref:response regulator n=1 Tax=Paenibacillus sp. FSL R5-0407 TaxID=2975320 RepID=UPI0030F5F757